MTRHRSGTGHAHPEQVRLAAKRSPGARCQRFHVAPDEAGSVLPSPPVYKDDALEAGAPGAYPWTLEEDAVYSVTPLPGKVFMTGEVAETLSRDFLASCVERIEEYRELARMRAGEGSAALGKAIAVDPSFFAVSPSRLVARTYLTYGWRYKGRTLRNRLPDIFKFEIFRHQYPRYVWVTEFSLPDDLRGFDQCQRKVRAHVVVDATGRGWRAARQSRLHRFQL